MPEQKIKKNDFIEIEFTGKANSEIFDTTSKEEAKEMGLQADVKPMIISVGNDMILKGLDKDLEGKEINKKYSLHLTSDQAFGPRKSDLIKTIPMKVFRQQNIQPIPGATLQMDQYIVKILSVSGGRVMADFNNPLAGKELDYEYKVIKQITDNREKINALMDSFFKQRFEFEIKDKKVIFKKPEIKPLVEMMNEKFKAITGLEFEVIEDKEKEKAKTPEKKENNSKK